MQDAEEMRGGSRGAHNPVDHIFQFHKALRRELHQIEFQVRSHLFHLFTLQHVE